MENRVSQETAFCVLLLTEGKVPCPDFVAQPALKCGSPDNVFTFYTHSIYGSDVEDEAKRH